MERLPAIPASLIEHAAHNWPKQLAILAPPKSISCHELREKIQNAKIQFQKLGIRQGEVVAVCTPQNWRNLVAIHALIDFGAIAFPVNPGFPDKLISEIFLKVGVAHVIAENNSEFSTISIENLFNESEGKRVNYTRPHNRPATLILTSGSSGEPKAVLHSFANHVYSAMGSHANIPFNKGDRWLLALPLFHVGGLAISFRAFLNGGTVVFPTQKDHLLDEIEKQKITHISLVAAQLSRLLREKKAKTILKSCKAILLGGSAIPAQLIEQAHAAGLPIHTSYGSSEMSSQITTTTPNASLKELKTSGMLLPFREIKIADDDEIFVRGATRFMGYFSKQGVEKPFDGDGFFATGDVGFCDDQDNLHVTGRKDNMFISGGENIQPEEIEKVLCEIPGVENACVVPVKNQEFGQRPVAFVKMSGGLDATLLKKSLRKKLPKFKVPDLFFEWPKGEQFDAQRAQFKALAETV